MLVEHAVREMELAGLMEKDADFDGMIPESVKELITVFAAQGHSGGSASMVIHLFHQLAQFKTLTPLTSNPAEWFDVSEATGEPMWQSTRCPSAFSRDGGKTWYDLDESKSE